MGHLQLHNSILIFVRKKEMWIRRYKAVKAMKPKKIKKTRCAHLLPLQIYLLISARKIHVCDGKLVDVGCNLSMHGTWFEGRGTGFDPSFGCGKNGHGTFHTIRIKRTNTKAGPVLLMNLFRLLKF